MMGISRSRPAQGPSLCTATAASASAASPTSPARPRSARSCPTSSTKTTGAPSSAHPNPTLTRHQVDHTLQIAEQHEGRPLYLFVNISATHVPHSHHPGDSHDTLTSQQAALAYADAHLGRLITTLTDRQRWLTILCADHGDAFGEDGYHGRGIAHPVVMNVPYAAIVR